MATNTTYTPQRWEDVEASKIHARAIGITDTVSAGMTEDIDTLFSDDTFIRAVEVAADNAQFGDTFSISIVDKDGVYFPVNTVVATPLTDYNVTTDKQMLLKYKTLTPSKLLGGLYIRVTYTSTGTSDVNLACNFICPLVLS